MKIFNEDPKENKSTIVLDLKIENYWDDDFNEFWSCDACGGNSESGCLSTRGECYRD